MIFGIPEMRAFAKDHEDPRVQALWRRLAESMAKNSKWCDQAENRQRRIEQLETAIKNFARKGRDGRLQKWAEEVLAGVTPRMPY